MADDAKPATDLANEVIPLWPEGPPTTIPDVGPEASYVAPKGVAAGTVMLRNISEPSLTVFRPDPAKANGVGVIVVPGGGWRILAWTHEGLDLARWLTGQGYTAFLLKYRVMGTPPEPAHFAAQMAKLDGRLAEYIPAARAPKAMGELMREDAQTQAREVAADDGRRAVEVVRARAAEWGVTKLGMIGFSAGAFLAADVAVDPRGQRLDFVAPIYGGETRGRPVPADAPPLFTCIAQDDRMLFHMVEGLYLDWSAADRPAEIHIFRRGAHGFGTVRQGLPSDRWIDLFGDWMADLGFA